MSKPILWRHMFWVAPLSFVSAGPLAAQQPADGAMVLEEIIVTARKREENLQDVPIAVTAISAAQLEREGIKDVEGLIARDPSLSFDAGIAPYDTRIVVRGLSPTRGRPNVASLIDGIDVSSEAIGVAGGSLLINPRLVDVQRIEVVKGPQSALYGRSAFAGAISYITADPDDVVGGSLSADFNDKEQYEIKSSLSLPLTDTLGVRLNGYRFEDQGYYENSVSGRKVGGGSGLGGTLTVKWTPTDSYSLKVRTEYSDDEFDQPAQVAVPFNGISGIPAAASSCRTYSIPNPAGGAALVATGPVLDNSCATLDPIAAIPGLVVNPVRLFETGTGNRGVYDDAQVSSFRGSLGSAAGRSVTYNPDYTRSTNNGLTAPEFPGTNRQVLRLSAVQELSVGLGTFASLTGYTLANVSVDLDFDKTDMMAIQQTIKTDNRTEQFNQEFRFTSDFDGPLQFIAGVQYWTERSDQFDRNSAVFGVGTSCVLVAAIPFPSPRGVCVPGGGFSSTSVTPYMDDVGAARQPSLIRRFVDHKSAYLEFEWDIVDSLRLIAEGRYVDEDNEVQGPITAGNQGPGTVILCGATGNCNVAANIPYAAQPGFPRSFAGAAQVGFGSFERNDSYFTPKATLQWQPSRDLNVYGSYSEGQKPGGFATLTIGAFGLPSRSDVEYEPEKIKVYELGAKWTAPSRRFQLNGSYFFQDFTDKQVSTQVIIGNTLGNRVTNAGGGELEGVELAAQWRATESLTFGVGVTHFLKYEYTDFVTLTGGAAEIARVGNCLPVLTVVAAAMGPQAQSTCQVSRTGNKFEDTPETAIALNAGYRAPVGANGSSWFIDLDANFTDQRFAEDDNTIWLDSYWLANLRIGIENDRWSALLYADNLLDDDTIRSGGTGPGNAFADVRTGVVAGPGIVPANLRNPVAAFGLAIPTAAFADLPRPRTLGLRVNYKF